MGIPRLTALLEAYFASAALGCSGSCEADHSQRKQKLTIDGPGLAYYIYYNVLSKSSAKSAFDAIPSYQLLGDAVVQWLDTLANHHIQIESIYFDGYLPPEKTQVRLTRLESYRKQLAVYHSNHVKGTFLRRATYESTHLKLFSGRPVSQPVTRGLPAAPFLVPAIIEAIKASRYSSVVKLVLGEADAFCAREARLRGCLIVTGDSDLLVHDLGSKGAVTFFDKIEAEPCQECGEGRLTAQLFQPEVVASRLGISDVLHLAFEIKRDPSASFAIVLQHTKDRIKVEDIDDFEFFASEYSEEKSIRDGFENARHEFQKWDADAWLDPRLCELVSQMTGLRADDGASKVYLPVLFDDPTRSSPWDVARDIRILAYSELWLKSPVKVASTVYEYCRRGSSIYPVHLNLFEVDVRDERRTALAQFILSRSKAYGRYSETMFWRSLSIDLILQYLIDAGRNLPNDGEVRSVLTVSPKKEWMEWSAVHLLAQLEAVLYSFRLLKQALSMSKHETQGLEDLGDVLVSLPPLVDMMPPRFKIEAECPDIGVIKNLARLSCGELADPAGGSNSEEDENNRSKKRRRKNKKAQPSTSEVVGPASNIFSLLADS